MMDRTIQPRFVPLTPELLAWAWLDHPDPAMARAATPQVMEALTRPPAWGEALLDQGRVMVAAGLVPHWPGRAEAWATVSRFAGRRHQVMAWRRCLAAIETAQRNPDFRRIEMNVQHSAPWRRRFADLLGFDLEGRMRKWHPSGQDFCLYARVAEGGA